VIDIEDAPGRFVLARLPYAPPLGVRNALRRCAVHAKSAGFITVKPIGSQQKVPAEVEHIVSNSVPFSTLKSHRCFESLDSSLKFVILTARGAASHRVAVDALVEGLPSFVNV